MTNTKKLYKLSDFSKEGQILIRYINYLIKQTNNNDLMSSEIKKAIFKNIDKIVALYKRQLITLDDAFYKLSSRLYD